ncbi:uncharacterized protein BDZ83DRAFT_165234 [Colletotrichum acutatum]|uniref:Secreted protein n=1 Tax=Glomerella acutata TaxID=27357 RepID=A0AAD9D2Q7_GLOAC|nr:uncharacterized protein BDZ83DRAFT_165234 [Colletotrichum acutatum]KAK1731602.1 hypothetical protein BDZ83DRAFT_165234 [Colletotrichum acutatum]
MWFSRSRTTFALLCCALLPFFLASPFDSFFHAVSPLTPRQNEGDKSTPLRPALGHIRLLTYTTAPATTSHRQDYPVLPSKPTIHLEITTPRRRPPQDYPSPGGLAQVSSQYIR